MISPSIAEIDRVLVDSGWPQISPWWQRVIDEVYASNVRNVVIRGGRRGGKSSTLAGKIAPHEVLSNKHVVPPGDIGYFAIISADKDQAQERLETCHKALSDLGIGHRKTANEITLDDLNVGIKAFAATLQAVVSFTCIGYLADEMARWRDKDTGENPAKQIITSLRATMLTMPNARGWHVSAPWSTLDEHHAMVAAGSNESQKVFIGTTPEMNPTITDEMILQLEPDEPSRQREYYVIPMAGDETKFFAASFIDDATKVVPWRHKASTRTVAGGDFAFRRNSSALVVLDQFGDQLKLAREEERIPGVRALVPSDTIENLAGIAVSAGADSIACDLHYIETVRETTERLSIELLEFPNDSDEITKAYIRLRVFLSKGWLDLAGASKRLIEQLKETTSQPTQTGMSIKNKTIGQAHGDLVSALVAAVWAADQPAPPKQLGTGERRFTRGVDETESELSDVPPESWAE